MSFIRSLAATSGVMSMRKNLHYGWEIWERVSDLNNDEWKEDEMPCGWYCLG
jgi:hypothetical protein